jgi:hypothetical protein
VLASCHNRRESTAIRYGHAHANPHSGGRLVRRCGGGRVFLVDLIGAARKQSRVARVVVVLQRAGSFSA